MTSRGRGPLPGLQFLFTSQRSTGFGAFLRRVADWVARILRIN